MLDILKLLLHKFIFSCFENTEKIKPINDLKSKKNINELIILIVDDSIVFTNIIKNFLNIIGLQYMCVENGKEAIETFEYFNFDIILTDINMPIIDGLQLIKYIRKISNVPIIAISSNKSYEESALYNGANIFISKPFRYNEFYKSVIYLLPNCNFDKIVI